MTYFALVILRIFTVSDWGPGGPPRNLQRGSLIITIILSFASNMGVLKKLVEGYLTES